MAQTGYTPILIYSSSTASNLPSASNLTNSTLGSELAINIADGKLFYKDTSNAVQVIAWKVTPTSAGGTGLTSYTAGDMLYYASGTALSKLAIGASGAYMSSSGTAPQWTAPAALTKTDDTNVTLTLGGSASTALLNAASLTLGWTGTLAVSRGGTGTGTAFTAGSVLFAGASGVYSQNNAKFFWDNTNGYLGINTNAPGYHLHVVGTSYFNATKSDTVNANANFLGSGGYWAVRTSTANDFCLDRYYGGSYNSLVVKNDTGSLLVAAGGLAVGSTTDPGATNLSVNGSAFIGTTSGISGSKLTVNGQIATSPFTAINSSAATTIATCVSCLAVLRDRGSGGTALILYDNSSSPAVVVVSQTGSTKFVTTAPGANEIQIANGGNSLTALTGASIGTTNLNICILQNQ